MPPTGLPKKWSVLDQKALTDKDKGLFKGYPFVRESDYSIPSLPSPFSDPSPVTSESASPARASRATSEQNDTNAKKPEHTLSKSKPTSTPEAQKRLENKHNWGGSRNPEPKPSSKSERRKVEPRVGPFYPSIYQDQMMWRDTTFDGNTKWSLLEKIITQEEAAQFLYGYFDWKPNEEEAVILLLKSMKTLLTKAPTSNNVETTEDGKGSGIRAFVGAAATKAAATFAGYAGFDLSSREQNGKNYNLKIDTAAGTGINAALSTVFKLYANDTNYCVTVFQTIHDVDGKGAKTFYNTFDKGKDSSTGEGGSKHIGKCNTTSEMFFWMTVDSTGETFDIELLTPVRDKTIDWNKFWTTLFDTHKTDFKIADRDKTRVEFDNRHNMSVETENFRKTEKVIDDTWKTDYQTTRDALGAGAGSYNLDDYKEKVKTLAKEQRNTKIVNAHKETFRDNNKGLAGFQKMKTEMKLDEEKAQRQHTTVKNPLLDASAYDKIFSQGIYQGDDASKLTPLFEDFFDPVTTPGEFLRSRTPKFNSATKTVDDTYLFRSVLMCLQGKSKVTSGRLRTFTADKVENMINLTEKQARSLIKGRYPQNAALTFGEVKASAAFFFGKVVDNALALQAVATYLDICINVVKDIAKNPSPFLSDNALTHPYTGVMIQTISPYVASSARFTRDHSSGKRCYDGEIFLREYSNGQISPLLPNLEDDTVPIWTKLRLAMQA